MCGIAGFINFNNSLTLADNANCIQQHRGPDSQQHWAYKNVVLAHQRLSIIDLDARADQPFVKNGLTIIFNGEIYNYATLKEKIQQEDSTVQFTTTSDTEVLLELYRIKKERCLDDLIGMFSFAIFDQATGQLFIARDHFGIKPLFYTQIKEGFAFASELKTLVKIPGFNKKVNLKALAGAINYLWIPGHESMFEECHKLPPAHYMTIATSASPLKVETHCYWKLDTTIKYTNEAETIATLKASMESSISRHMVADVPVSSFLSGGLDSSLISVMASKLNPKLSTYTIGTTEADRKVEQMPEDEKYAKLLAKQHHFDHHEIVLQSDIVKELPKMVYTLDEPIGDPAALVTYLICKAAKDKGVKVLLSGMGADEMFFGYRRQKATMFSINYKKFPPLIRKPVIGLVNFLPVKLAGRGVKLTRWAKRFLSFAELPVEEAYMRSYSYYEKKEIQALFKIDIEKAYTHLRESHSNLFHKYYPNDPINQMCFTDLHMFMLGLNLSYTDRASMAASVEVRVPFIDKEVVETAMQIKGSLKFKKGISKYILKKVAESYLPHGIIYRPKASFGAPIRSWISGELRPLVDDLLSETSVEKRGFFNYHYIKELIENDRKGVEDNAYRIYQLITLELWCRHYIDN